ncbi:YhcH/YjgK/YiaL family protein [Shewanella yunxiaonensis]|uniref:YhcH/YjgK/YiaL family protein n=1 Tax=Shewanella yunxiaonensis TaxID=2829809 RepID=A0ABX7YS02_9GAMM|nr:MULTISPECIES: YhcH/YjgK/YiaL family protein [Shewanella]MDF0534183.1 YhcH/YjgK/YiaL family protein [Shewanella sp. A32]QUN05522.1 YhcH/YjgK/YiaL family protein [Shewanella yunxiaonensis]
MIIDTLANRSLYSHLHPRLNAALEYLATTDFSTLAKGSYALEGKSLFAIISDYTTVARGTEPFEVHRRYIDVQYIVSGEEEFGFLPKPAHQQPCSAYNDERDFEEYSYDLNQAAASYVALKSGMFAIFYPDDAHMPCCTLGAESQVRKVVVKVQIAD